jgi:hypothetical protein
LPEVLVALVTVFFISTYLILFASGNISYHYFWGVLSIALILTYYLTRKNRMYNKIVYQNELVAANKKLKLYKLAMSRYEKLLYCYRDDCVFIPGEEICVPVNRIGDLLYKK